MDADVFLKIAPPELSEPLDQIREAPRHENDRPHDHHTEEYTGEMGYFARENFRDRRQSEGAQHGAKNGSGTTEYGHDDHFDIQSDIECAAGIEIGNPIGVNAAGKRCEDTA